MRSMFYKLDKDGVPRTVSMEEWAFMFEDVGSRVVKQEHVHDVLVSTVFLGFDHNYRPDGPPILWETMVFEENRTNDKRDKERFPVVERDGYTERCSGNKEQAEAMHDRVVALIKEEHAKKNR